MNQSFKRFLSFLAIAGTGMYAFNKFIEFTSQSRNLTFYDDENYYSWRNGTIFYQKKGKGKPILLIHDLNPISSSIEWKNIIDRLSKNHTVYAIDLIGCGKSDKPEETYINFLYVKLVNDFIQDIIQEKTDIVATGASFTFSVMASRMAPEQINHLITINPSSISQNNELPDLISKCKKRIFELPIIGTFIYNMIARNNAIYQLFETKYYENFTRIPSKLIDIYYEAAHLQGSKGKFLYGSIVGNYTNINIDQAIKLIDHPITMIMSKDYLQAKEYLKLNSNIKHYEISHLGYLPQLEYPDKIIKIIENEIG